MPTRKDMLDEPLLVVDVGNTSTALAVFHRGRIERMLRLDSRSRGPAASRRAVRELTAGAVTASAVCSVVPERDALWRTLLRKQLGAAPLFIRHTLELGVPLDYPYPERIGADRLANAAGAVRRHGAPVIVADFGTALTFDIVAERKGYIGGIIAPGLPLMFDYLAERTAQLPHIEPGPVRRAVGRSTEEAMQLGARIGYRGMVKGIFEHLLRRWKGGKVTLCATGGYADWVLRGLDLPVRFEKDLTLYGIAVIYSLNRGKDKR